MRTVTGRGKGTAKQKALTPKQKRLLTAGDVIAAEDPSPEDKTFLARYMVQATLPHRSPRDNPPVWFRTNGDYTLSVRPGYVRDPKTRELKCVGYPFGSVPRLLMFWITTEALRTRSHRLTLGSSLTQFMRTLGLNPDNGGSGAKRSDARRLRDQMERLFRATLSFEYDTLEVRKWLDMPVAPKGELWWSAAKPDEPTLWESWIELGREFHEAIVAAPVPVDVRVLRELKQSPLALDLYTWATYKTHVVTQHGKPQRVSWKQLLDQLGAEYADPKDFRKKALDALRKISVLARGLRLEEDAGSLVVKPGLTSIRPKR